MTKVTAHIEKQVTTLDHDTGEVTLSGKGALKGIGGGFRDYVTRGPKQAEATVVVQTGQYPVGHPLAGKWAVQIMLSPFDTEEDAATLSLRVETAVRTAMKGPTISLDALREAARALKG
jgi:hypothetical protein